MERELELKALIIETMKREKAILAKVNATLEPLFISGFIYGVSVAENTEIPSHWYDIIIKEIEKA